MVAKPKTLSSEGGEENLQVQIHTWPHSELELNLGHMRPWEGGSKVEKAAVVEPRRWLSALRHATKSYPPFSPNPYLQLTHSHAHFMTDLSIFFQSLLYHQHLEL